MSIDSATFDSYSVVRVLESFGGPTGKGRISTGFARLDENLDGGLPAPGLTVLGAIPGIGKSTLALQIADHVASSGTTVFLFSLEMTKEQMVAKIISRHSYQKHGREGGLRALTVLTTEEQPQSEEGKAARATIDELRKELAQSLTRLYICDPDFESGRFWSAKNIVEGVEDFLSKRAEAQENIPLVVVDYLQTMHHETIQSDRLAINDSLNDLRKLSNSKASVLLISSLNRISYRDPVSLTSFKETGAIEYAADVLLGLQFAAVGAQGYDPNVEKARDPRRLQIVVPKNRYGASGDRATVGLEHLADFNHFCEVPEHAAANPHDYLPTYMNIAYELAALIREGRLDELPDGIKRSSEGKRMLASGEIPNTDVSYKLSWPAEDKPLGAYDMMVADAIYTLYLRDRDGLADYGESGTEVALRELLAIMGGSRLQKTTARENAITESIERMRRVRISIDMKTDRSAGRQIAGREIAFLEKSNPFLSLGEDKGRMILKDGYALPLYRYAELRQHMVRIPAMLLNVEDASGKKVWTDNRSMLVTHYLVRRAERLRNPNNKSCNPRVAIVPTSDSAATRAMTPLAYELTSGDDGGRRRELTPAVRRSVMRIAVNAAEHFVRIGYLDSYEKNGDCIVLGKVRDPWSL